MSEPENVMQPDRGQDDGTSLLDLLIVLAKHKKLILGLPLIVAVITAGITLILPKSYTATTRILPPQQATSSAAAMLNQLGGLAGAAAGAAGLKNPNDLYVGMLKSRTVADKLIARFDLGKVYDEQYPTFVRKSLEKHTLVTSGKDGIIAVDVEDRDPKRAASLANGYVEELTDLTRVLAVTEASRRRLFFEQQLAQAKDNLVKAETTARQGLQQGGLVKVDEQGRAMVENIAHLRGQIAVKEVQLGSMRTFAAQGNPDLRLAEQELVALKHELDKLEGSGGQRDKGMEGKTGMANLGLLRDIKYFETIYELLARQYEIAKIDEAKDSAVIQVLDKAIEPDRKSSPKRALIVLIVTLLAALVAVTIASLRESFERSKSDPDRRERLAVLRGYWTWK